MDGKHSIDVGMLVMPLLMEMIMLVGDMADVKYDSGMENPNKKKTRDTLVTAATTKLKRQLEKKESMIFDDKELGEGDTEEQEPVVIEQEEEPKGLMARRV